MPQDGRGQLPPSIPPPQLPVHLWRAALDVGAEAMRTAWALLDPGERLRAERMAHAGARGDFVLARAALRRRLGTLLGREPTGLRFAATSAGKPYCPDVPDLHFTLAHGGDWALLAACRAGPVGIDIEPLRPVAEAEAVAADLFSPAEQADLAAAPEGDRARCFLRLWVRREALLKALGTGFAGPAPPAHPDLTVEALAAPPGYVAALARPARSPVLRHET